MEFNGVDTAKLQETMDRMKSQPDLGAFRFHVANTWREGTRNTTKIKDFYGAGTDDTSRDKEFVLEADEPPVLLGHNDGVNPVEYLLGALASCVTTSLVVHAAARNIKLHAVRSHVEGELDVRGFMGWQEVPVGYQGIHMMFHIEADCSQEECQQLLEMGAKHSPVFNSITRGVPVSLELADTMEERPQAPSGSEEMQPSA